MTAAELRRLAARIRVIATARDAAADRLVAVVRDCSGGLADVVPRSRASWTGRAAVGFVGVVHGRMAVLELTMDDLRRNEHVLRRDARAGREEAQRLERRADELDAAPEVTLVP